MKPDDLRDARLEQLAQLARPAPEPARAERLRVRCRTRLERRRRREARAVSTIGHARRVIVPIVVGGLCLFYVAYVSALVATTLGLEGVLR